MTDAAPASRAPHVPSFVSLLGPLVRRGLGAGLPFGPNVLLTVVGRTSGEPRTVPVAILETEGRRYVQSPFGEVHWVRNLRAAGVATLSKGDDRTAVTATELDPEDGGPVLRATLAPILRSRVGAAVLRRTFGVKRGWTDADYVAMAGRHPMFELLETDAG
jgi:deazaflavin-dependent oxidoreductase (nitroreductase family)